PVRHASSGTNESDRWTIATNRSLRTQRSPPRPSRDSNPAWRDDDEGALERAVQRHERSHHVGADVAPRPRRIPQQDHAREPADASANQHAEVLVLCDEDASLASRASADFLVRDRRRELTDGDDVVPRLAQGSDDGVVAALVCEELHPLPTVGRTILD